MLTCWHPDPEKRPTFVELTEQIGSMVNSADREVANYLLTCCNALKYLFLHGEVKCRVLADTRKRGRG